MSFRQERLNEFDEIARVVQREAKRSEFVGAGDGGFEPVDDDECRSRH